MKDQDIARIVAELTNFYKDHLPMDSSFVRLLGVYGKLFDWVYQEARYVDNSTFIDRTDTLRTIPYFKLDAVDGLYSQRRALEIMNLSLDEQIKALDQAGQYIQMAFRTENVRHPLVYSLTLKQTFDAQQALALYTDYLIRDNKIFMLPGFILNRQTASDTLHAFDIKVDDKRLERNWGVFYDLELSTLIPRFEYRDVLAGFDRAFSSELTIREIRNAIQQVTKWSTFSLQDMKSPTLPPAKKRLYDNWLLSPAEFIVSIPEAIIYDKVRVAIITHLLDQIKEPNTNYRMFYDIVREDQLRKAHDTVMPTYKITRTSHNVSQDTPRRTIKMTVKDAMFDNEPDIYYDHILKFNGKYRYDLDVAAAFDYTSAFDNETFDLIKQKPSDYFGVRERSFPEIPRQFAGAANSGTGDVTLTMRPNNDGTTGFELHGATAENGIYELLQSTANDEAAASVTMIYNAISSGKKYYKVRAIAGAYSSLMTLPLHIEV